MLHDTEHGGRSVTLRDALSMWSSWNADRPPIDATGDSVADRHLAGTFVAMALKHTQADRLDCIRCSTRAALGSLIQRRKALVMEVLARWERDLRERPSCITVSRVPPTRGKPADLAGRCPDGKGTPPSRLSTPFGHHLFIVRAL